MNGLARPVDGTVGEKDGLGGWLEGLLVLPAVGPDVGRYGEFLAVVARPKQVAPVLRRPQRERPVLVCRQGRVGDAVTLIVQVPNGYLSPVDWLARIGAVVITGPYNSNRLLRKSVTIL